MIRIQVGEEGSQKYIRSYGYTECFLKMPMHKQRIYFL